MRLLIYGTLAVVALILGVDTHLGETLSASQTSDVQQSIDLLYECGLRPDAGLAVSLIETDSFRASRFFNWLSDLSQSQGGSFGFYAYTPVLSRRLVFLGPSFWAQNTEGRASIAVHELAHIRRHRVRSMRGFPRSSDEASAYRYQYHRYPEIGIDSVGVDGEVYWDMMLGIREYVIPERPQYAKREDIARALSVLEWME